MSAAEAHAKPTLATRLRINENVLVQEVQDEAVLLNLDSGTYFGLDPVGTRIWQLLARQERLIDIAQAVVAEYDVTEDRCAQDLLTLVSELEEKGLVSRI